jgi:hypothetical protein
MKIRNEQQYPVFHRYAGKGRAGRNLKPGQVSPEVPNDRIHLSVVQRHLLNGQVAIFVTPAEKEALKGNVPDGVYEAIKTSEPECAVAKARQAPRKAPRGVAPVEPPPEKAIKAPPKAAPEEPAAPVVEEPEEPKTGKAPDPAAQPKSKHLDEKPKEGPAKTAKDLTEDPIKKHAKKTTAKKPAEKKPAAKKSTAKKPAEKKAAAPKKEAAVKDYKDLDKAALLKEFENRGLKKPAPTTSTTRLRSKLIKDDESK